jgi:hypothetical protein
MKHSPVILALCLLFVVPCVCLRAGGAEQRTDILKVRDGKITDNWHLEDNLTFLKQIGFVTVH